MACERQAEFSLERAFAINPLLEREYGRLFIDHIAEPETITMVEEWDRIHG